MIWQQVKPRVLEVLGGVFGFQGFRGVQEDAVKAALQGRDSFILMPTGGGKSLCYALPAAFTGGLALVVSPLIALMQDQVAALQATGLTADYLSSTRTATERKHVMEQLTPTAAKAAMAAGSNSGGGGSSSRLALLYVTPELIATDSFRQRLRALHTQCPGYIKLVAVDEAHCISHWGHDYRPTYRQLCKLRVVLQGVPCMALTATATPQVREDILTSLQLSNPAVLTSSFNRPNIHYTILLLDVQTAPEVATTAGNSSSINTPSHAAAATAGGTRNGVVGVAGLEGDDDAGADDVDHAGYRHLLHLLKPHGRRQPRAAQQADADAPQQQQQQQRQHGQGQGAEGRQWPGPIAIVYALKRSTVDALTRRLRGEGLAVAAYHAALPAATRAEVLQQWRAGQLQAVVASVAFGMGVDKGDIELVVHYNLPRSIEGFYQESGRAGRNGQPARSVLMYATRDRRRMDWILQQDANKKASRKRKKQAASSASASASGAAQAGAGGSTVQEADRSSDPAVAAAALLAFGGVVDLCCIAGCRRRRLLSHFGEALQQQQEAQAGHRVVRCCDFCDNAASVEAAVQQLQLFEQQMVQSRFGRQGGGGPAGHKRLKAGEDGLHGCGGSSDEEDEAEDISDVDSPDEHSYEVAAALAAAKRQAAAAATARQRAPGTGAKTTAGPAGTDAFLAAMLKAEQAHDRKAAAAAGTAGGSTLEQLIAAKKAKAETASQVPPSVPSELRDSRCAKLAAMISSNSHLQGCSNEVAGQLAAAYEAHTAAGCGADAAQHKSQLMQVLARCKGANSWLDLPELKLLSGASLQAALKHGVAEAVAAATAAAAQSGSESGMQSQDSQDRIAADKLQQLAQLRVSADALEATGVAAAVKRLRKHSRSVIAAAATQTITAWREAVASGG